jgi:hypothetical protein
MARSEIATAKLAALDKVGEDDLFELLATGTSMRDLCKQHDVGHKLWYRWLDSAPGRRDRYEAALMEAAHYFADRAVKTAQMTDPSTVNADRLKVDTDKWIASKLNSQYDTRQKDVAINISVNDLHAQAAQLLGDVIEGEAEDVSDD